MPPLFLMRFDVVFMKAQAQAATQGMMLRLRFLQAQASRTAARPGLCDP